LCETLIDEAIARNMKLDISELPPNETNGIVTPTTGRIPIFMPAFRKNCMRRKRKQQRRKDFSKRLLLSMKIIYKRYKRKKNARMIIRPPINPIPSEMVAKIKSVCLSGRNRRVDWVPSPKPFPENIPEPTAINAWMLL